MVTLFSGCVQGFSTKGPLPELESFMTNASTVKLAEILTDQLRDNKQSGNSLTRFELDLKMFVQMHDDPADRLFNQQEKFLSLRKLIKVDYLYKIDPILKLEQLQQDMKAKLTRQKEVKVRVVRKSFMDWHKYSEEVVQQIDDKPFQEDYLQRMLTALKKANYGIKQGKSIESFVSSHNPLALPTKEAREKWVDDFTNKLVQNNQSNKCDVSSELAEFCQFTEVLISDRDKPTEKRKQHNSIDARLADARYVKEPKIVYRVID